MFDNHTNQLPLFLVNRTTPNEPPPRYTRRDRAFFNFDNNLLFGFRLNQLRSTFAIHDYFGQIFVFHQLERAAANCIAMQRLE